MEKSVREADALRELLLLARTQQWMEAVLPLVMYQARSEEVNDVYLLNELQILMQQIKERLEV
jgi:hypothetical protein